MQQGKSARHVGRGPKNAVRGFPYGAGIAAAADMACCPGAELADLVAAVVVHYALQLSSCFLLLVVSAADRPENQQLMRRRRLRPLVRGAAGNAESAVEVGNGSVGKAAAQAAFQNGRTYGLFIRKKFRSSEKSAREAAPAR